MCNTLWKLAKQLFNLSRLKYGEQAGGRAQMQTDRQVHTHTRNFKWARVNSIRTDMLFSQRAVLKASAIILALD